MEQSASSPGASMHAESELVVGDDLCRTDVSRVAVVASRIRSAILFVLLDAVWVAIGYGLSEVIYFRNSPPNAYSLHFSEFEARQLLLSAATTLCVLIAFWPIGNSLHIVLVPPVVVIIGCMFASIGMGILRFHSRLFAWQRGSKRLGLRVAVIGSRDAGAAAIREMLRSPGAGLVPVAVFDDDERSHGLSLLGVPVVGAIDEIPKAASRYTIQQVLLAIPSPSPELVERALRASELAGVSMKMLPGVKDMLNEPNHLAALRQAREPQIEDLLGRTPVPTDLESVRRSIEGRRVLVTGAGGSIGSEICRQVASLGPAQLILLAKPCLRRSSSTAPRSSITPPRISMSPYSSNIHSRRPRPTCSEPCTWWTQPAPSAPAASCRSPRTRPSTPRASWAHRSGWPSRPSWPMHLPAPPTAPCASGTSWAAGAASSPPSAARSPRVGRSP